MARAATKRGKRTKQAPRPRPQTGRVGGSAKSVEQQLFFGRMRRSAKWVFALLAVVFAGTFAFLGVGSGNSGLGDLLNGRLFGHSSSTSIKSLQKKVAKNPKDAAAYLQLGSALDAKGQTNDAIDAFRHYTTLRPRNVDGWNQLAAEYLKQAQKQSRVLQSASATASPLVDPSEFSPGGKLGAGLASYSDPLQQAFASTASSRVQQLQPQLQATVLQWVAASRKYAALQPNDPTVQIGFAQVAQQAAGVTGDLSTALAAYQRFVKRFPDDSFAPSARKQIKAIKKQLHG